MPHLFVRTLLCLALVSCAFDVPAAQAQGDRRPDAERVAALHVALLQGRAGEFDDLAVLERALLDLRDAQPEARARSLADTRRPTLVRRILALDPDHALANEEAALGAWLDYEWRRRDAVHRGLWGETSQTRKARRSQRRAVAHLDRVLAREPGRMSAHRLHVRLSTLDDADDGLERAAQSALAARPDRAEAHLWAGLAATRTGRMEDAERHIENGLSRLDAAERRPFESPARFVRPDDRAAWDADSVGWAARFWRSRDPRLLTPANERWLAHAARLVTADLLYAFGDVRGWDTARGDTYVRYGAPLAEDGALAVGGGLFYTWTYLWGVLTFGDLTINGEVYFTSSSRDEDSVIRARSQANTVGETYTPAVPPTIQVPVLVSAFRGEAHSTDVVVAYGVPLGPGQTGERLGLRTGAFLLDSSAVVHSQTIRTVERAGRGSVVPFADGMLWTDAATLHGPAGTYTLAVEVEHPATTAYGVSRTPVEVRDLWAPSLVLSDLLLATASDDEPDPVSAGWVRRGEIRLQPSPWGAFATDAPLVVYAEAYGLSVDAGRTRYAVEARLAPVDQASVLRRLARTLRGRRPTAGVAVSFEAAGDAPDEAVRLDLDVSALSPGDYALTLTVRDLVAGRDRSATRRVLLAPPLTP